MAGETNKNYQLEVTTKTFLPKIMAVANEYKLNFTDYQKECVVNALRTLDPMITASQYSWNSFDQNNVMTVLNQVAFLKLNPSATPRECYFIIRKNWNSTTGKYDNPTLEFGIEGAGNDRILREFGEDVKEVKSYIVYKGDKFTNGYMNGFDWVLPRYERTFETSIPEKAVYLIKHHNGDIDVAYATLDDVKKSLLAHAKQNGAEKELLDEMAEKSFEELIDPKGKYANYKLTKKRKVAGKWEDYQTPLISPAWTDHQSRDNMVERKLRNHATRKYPKNFETPFIQEQYEETFEEEKYKRNVVETTAEEHIENAQLEFDEKAGKEELQTPKGNPDAGEEFVVTTEQPYEYAEPNEEEPSGISDDEEQEPTVITAEPEPQQKAPKTTTTNNKPAWLKK